MKPADPIAHVRALHASYEARTGYTIRWNMHREHQWGVWCAWSDWQWTEADLARVIHYLRSKIAKGERNDGALKFDNLIGRPDCFEEDLNLAKEAAKGSPTFQAKPKAAKPAEDIPAAERATALDWIKSLKKPQP